MNTQTQRGIQNGERTMDIFLHLGAVNLTSIVLDISTLVVVIVPAAVALGIYVINALINLNERLAKVETNIGLLLDWVKCLNGEMSTKKEYTDFMKKLKKVTSQKDCMDMPCKDSFNE
jgi:hypothetical protein